MWTPGLRSFSRLTYSAFSCISHTPQDLLSSIHRLVWYMFLVFVVDRQWDIFKNHVDRGYSPHNKGRVRSTIAYQWQIQNFIMGADGRWEASGEEKMNFST